MLCAACETLRQIRCRGLERVAIQLRGPEHFAEALEHVTDYSIMSYANALRPNRDWSVQVIEAASRARGLEGETARPDHL